MTALTTDRVAGRHRRLLRPAVPTTLLLIATLILQATLELPYRPRFANAAANYWAVALLSVLTPVLVFLCARMTRRTVPRWLGFTAAGVLSLPCVVISGCAALEAPRFTEDDRSYELLSEAPAGATMYRLYRTNCGATCAFGLDLREEIDLPIGLKLVTPRWSLYRASEGAIKMEGARVLVMDGEKAIGEITR